MQSDVVDLSNTDGLNHKNGNQYKYELYINSQVDKKNKMIVRFPFHRIKHEQMLSTTDYKNCIDLNREINNRLCSSTIKNNFSIGKKQFTAFIGNVYLVWCKLRKQNYANIDIALSEMSPVLIVKDGNGNYKGPIYIFEDNIKVKLDNCQIMLHGKRAIFCLESDSTFGKIYENLQIVHESIATDRITNSMHDNILNEIDYEEDSDSSDNNNNINL
jgi:hypothetical protein